MTLVSDLVQALLIPLFAWDVQVLGAPVTLPVTPLALGLLALGLDHAGRLLRRRTRRHRAALPSEDGAPGGLIPTEA